MTLYSQRRLTSCKHLFSVYIKTNKRNRLTDKDRAFAWTSNIFFSLINKYILEKYLLFFLLGQHKSENYGYFLICWNLNKVRFFRMLAHQKVPHYWKRDELIRSLVFWLANGLSLQSLSSMVGTTLLEISKIFASDTVRLAIDMWQKIYNRLEVQITVQQEQSILSDLCTYTPTYSCRHYKFV